MMSVWFFWLVVAYLVGALIAIVVGVWRTLAEQWRPSQPNVSRYRRFWTTVHCRAFRIPDCDMPRCHEEAAAYDGERRMWFCGHHSDG
jgi:hypothetical protein